jgi:predicted transcriptional regulator of viral defense system/very-short-patch-repair endonuclease
MVTIAVAALVTRAALENGGRVTREDAVRLGINPDVLTRLARAGALERVRRGSYVLPGARLEGPGAARLAAVELGAAVSHRSALQLYAVDTSRWAAPLESHVTVEGYAKRSSPSWVVVHRTRHLRAADLSRVHGTDVTSPSRTLVDVSAPAAGFSNDQLVECLDHLVSARYLTVAGLHAYLRRAPRLPGIGRLRALLEQIGADRVESSAERRLLRLLHEAGLPGPVTQYRLYDGKGGFVARIDAAWPAHKTAVEMDGYRYHSGTRAFRDDRERGNRIQAEGWTLYRTTPAAVADGAPELVAALRNHLCQAAPPSREGRLRRRSRSPSRIPRPSHEPLRPGTERAETS